MTDKQTIIDGVDVSRCEFNYIEMFAEHYGCNLYPPELNCEYHPNCLFKQLARKTQECEELKEQLIQKDEVNTFFNTPIECWDNDTCKICESKQNYDKLKIDKAKLEAQIEADTQYHIKEECNLRNIIKNKEKRNAVLYKENNQLKTENETYKKMLDNPEVRVALTDVRTGERDLWQKYKPRMEQAEQKLKQLKPILEYYANSYIGEKQLDGRYRYDLGDVNCILYDPRKAEEGLKIINEVEK